MYLFDWFGAKQCCEWIMCLFDLDHNHIPRDDMKAISYIWFTTKKNWRYFRLFWFLECHNSCLDIMRIKWQSNASTHNSLFLFILRNIYKAVCLSRINIPVDWMNRHNFSIIRISLIVPIGRLLITHIITIICTC